jgi:type I restriction enzyme S subunit
MSSWVDQVPLKELGEIVSGSTPSTHVEEYWGGDIPWITPADLTNHSGIFFRGKLRKITQAGYDSCSTRLLPEGSILFSSRAPIGHCAVTTFPLCTNQGFKSIVPNERLDSVYGFFALKFFTPQIVARGRGATFSEVNKEIIENFRIPLPPLPEQQRIAAILSRADRLRRLRRTARELSDTYLQSVFLEMFGDPVTNPMGWERAKASDLGKVQTGNTPSRNAPENYGSHIEWIKSDNITLDEMFVTRSLEMLSKEGLQKGRFVEAGSILVTCIAGSPTSIGNVALADRKVAFNQQINAVTPYEDVDSLFLYGLFRVAKPLVQRSTTLGMKRIITKSKFEKLFLIKPPLPLQQQFAHIVRKFDRLRAQQREAERQAEHLFQALLQRAFRGEV